VIEKDWSEFTWLDTYSLEQVAESFFRCKDLHQLNPEHSILKCKFRNCQPHTAEEFIALVSDPEHLEKFLNERPMVQNLAASNDGRTFVNMIDDELEEINSLCKQDHLELAK
jgi:hypothetical protein